MEPFVPKPKLALLLNQNVGHRDASLNDLGTLSELVGFFSQWTPTNQVGCRPFGCFVAKSQASFI